jgi:hypothetical protein
MTYSYMHIYIYMNRAYYCDMGWVREGLAKALKHLKQPYIVPIDNKNQIDDDYVIEEGRGKGVVTSALPHMRFLQYESVGACSPPHIG